MKKAKNMILLVEDEQPLLDAIRFKLEKSGFSVVSARSVEVARNHLKDIERIDAIWLDHYLLGKENGLDFIASCKQVGSACLNVPIFVVSNTASHDKVQSYLRLGAVKYYVKAEKRLEEIISDINEYLAKPE